MDEKLSEPDYKALEILVTKIQQQLAPDATVEHNVKLPGRHSKRDRQIDVLVRQQIGQYQMMIVLDCKDYAEPVDVKGVEEFHGLVDDVGAHKGALVSPKGFTKAAKERAAGMQIDLFSPVDTDPHKWQVKVAVPMICDFREAMVSFQVRFSAPLPCRMPADFFHSVICYDPGTKEELGNVADTALLRWEEGRYPSDPGEHRDLPIFPTKTVLADNGYGMLAPFELTVSLHVESRLYFGYMPVSEISGFRDELSGKIFANAFTIGILDPNTVEEKWKRIAVPEEAPVPVAMRLTGLIGYEH